MEEWSVSGSKQTAPACFCWHWFKSSARSKTPHGCYKLSAPQTKLIFSFLLLLPSNLFLYFHLSLPLSHNHHQFHFLISPFSSCPTSIFSFLFQMDPSPSLFPNPPWCFPYPYHTFTTCQEDLGLCGFCPALGVLQLRLHWAGCRFDLRSRPRPTVRKWPLLWFKLAMRQRNRVFFFFFFAGDSHRKEKKKSRVERMCSHLQTTWKWVVIDSKPSLIKYYVGWPKNILPEVVVLL